MLGPWPENAFDVSARSRDGAIWASELREDLLPSRQLTRAQRHVRRKRRRRCAEIRVGDSSCLESIFVISSSQT